MFTGFETTDERPAAPRSWSARSDAAHAADTAPHDALLEDLAADPTDLLDLAALLGVEFRSLVADLRATRASSAAELIRNLGTVGPQPRTAIPQPEPLPFVWVRVLPPRAASPTLRAGWLTAVALDAIVADARRVGRGSRIEIIVPLDSGEAATLRVRALCAAVTDDVPVSVHAQSEYGASGPRSSSKGARGGMRTPRGNAYHASWVAFGPVGVRP